MSKQSDKPQNIAILGAGILGLTGAYTLTRQGHAVTLYDPAGFPARNASLIAGGMLAPYAEIEHMPMPFVEAGLQGIELWKTIIAGLPTQPDFQQKGSLFLAHQEDLHMLKRFASHLPDSAPVRYLEKDGIQELEPQIPSRFTAGFWIENEAHLYPEPLIEALIETLKTAGAILKQEAAEPEALQTTYDHIIDCRGQAAIKNDPNLRGVKGELAVVENREFSLSRALRLMHPRYPLYIVPRPDHRFMIGATIIESADNESPSVRSSLELLSALYSLHPSFGDAKLLTIEAGIRPAYADNLPAIKRSGKVIICNGSFRHGYLLAPPMARDIAALIENENAESIFLKNSQERAAA